MTPSVYLAGLISTDHPESLAWRDLAGGRLGMAGFEVITPMRGKDNLAKHTRDGGVTDPSRTPRDIVLRDYHDVERANVILVHLELFGSNRPLIGTLCELAWAWQLRKPVIAICSEDNKLMRNHPFISEFVAHYYPDLYAAIKGVKQVI